MRNHSRQRITWNDTDIAELFAWLDAEFPKVMEWLDKAVIADFSGRCRLDADTRVYALSGGMALVCAEIFLQKFLANGACPQNLVRERAEADGYSWATVRRAKKSLGVKSRKLGFSGAWVWCLP
ncbi:MAG: hypothetical protein FWD67_11185 [Betaproteobacteria bacterium]|nr:hypothetical protein [Betaproteobacteria bacterium]